MSHATRPLQPQVSAYVRFAAAAGVCAVLALVVTFAEQCSHQAVQTDTAAFSSGPAQDSQPVQTAGCPAPFAPRT